MKEILKLAIIVAIVGIVVWQLFYSQEGFVIKNNELNANSVSAFNPMLYEKDLSLLTSASDFVGLPDVVIPAWGSNSVNYGTTDTLLAQGMGNAGLEFNMCSKSCCSPQYPVPFSIDTDPLVCGKEFQPSPYTCNNGWQDSGCVCLTKEQSNLLGSRGNNA
jgi:hypothetical protein